ncbi:MAG: CmcI family methyltransferase [Rhodoglobus sp.]
MNETPTSHGTPVPDADAFAAERDTWRRALADDEAIRAEAVALQVSAEGHHYTYQREWAGVPIIRLPDDIAVFQELVWEYRPQRIIETGIARGGSLLLDAAMQRMAGLEPSVLGIDIAIYPHTHELMEGHPLATGVQMLESDSTLETAVEATRKFLGDAERALLVLDSNHTHDHVLGELRALAPLLPVGSYVLVADTIVEEFPEGHYQDRSWDRGNNPMTAARAFVAERDDFELDRGWSRRALVTEFRDGILIRTGV